MKKYVIERTVPNAGALSKEELAEITKVSIQAINDLGKQYHWIETFVVEDKLFCVHIAPDEETVREHSALGCFPIDRIYEVKSMIDPTSYQS